jgi:hypothetical protein
LGELKISEGGGDLAVMYKIFVKMVERERVVSVLVAMIDAKKVIKVAKTSHVGVAMAVVGN